MSNIKLIIEERPNVVGNFMVGRLLPFKDKRMVGPFAFIDHMGPIALHDYENFDVPPHPHIGLSTLTYLFEGSIMHKDSLGSEVEIKPGEVNWMTAGNGIVHSERTPEYLRHSEKSLHGLQIWVLCRKISNKCSPIFTMLPIMKFRIGMKTASISNSSPEKLSGENRRFRFTVRCILSN